jgi:hypothetical protein
MLRFGKISARFRNMITNLLKIKGEENSIFFVTLRKTCTY